MMLHFKKQWFAYIALVCAFSSYLFFSSLGETVSSRLCQEESDKPNCYIFYGIAQNDIDKAINSLKVNYLIQGFPSAEHKVFVTIKNEDDEIDFLYSELHHGQHRSHKAKNGGQRKYVTKYKIPKLKSGTYWLQVHFDFKVGVLGSLKAKRLTSNWIKFEVK